MAAASAADPEMHQGVLSRIHNTLDRRCFRNQASGAAGTEAAHVLRRAGASAWHGRGECVARRCACAALVSAATKGLGSNSKAMLP